jgi:hypothetical protein
MRGLDPRIHLLAKRMDCRVKPGNDNRFNMTGNRCWIGAFARLYVFFGDLAWNSINQQDTHDKETKNQRSWEENQHDLA